MNKNVKSLLWSFTIVFGLIYSTYVWVKLFWNTSNYQKLQGRVIFILLLKFILIPIYFVSVYHIVGVYKVDEFYKPIIIIEIIYIFGGVIFGFFIPDQESDKLSNSKNITLDTLFTLYKKRVSNKTKESN
jgi:hypothetical protein